MPEHDKKLDESESKDTYQEVAEEIADVIKYDLFDSSEFDVGQIAEVLRRRFNIKDEGVGKALMSDVTMFRIFDGGTFEIPMFGTLAFADLDVRPIISGKCYPNYNIRNKYMGYTNDGVFCRITEFGIFLDSIKKNPMLILACIIAGISVGYTVISI